MKLPDNVREKEWHNIDSAVKPQETAVLVVYFRFKTEEVERKKEKVCVCVCMYVSSHQFWVPVYTFLYRYKWAHQSGSHNRGHVNILKVEL